MKLPGVARSLDSRWLLILLAAGVLIRLVLAFAFVGVEFDIESFQIIRRELATGSPLEVYGATNLHQVAGDVEFLRWPYPPGFFPWIGVAAIGENVLGLPFHGTIQVLPILADVGIALAVYVALGWRSEREALRLGAVAVVMLGPSFVAISGYHGQIDSVAILPAVLAVMVWSRNDPHRALVAGLLLGLGGAVKWVPLFMVLALLPSARSLREAATLATAAAVVPVVALAPFAVADPDGVATIFGYNGAPGLGGLGLAVQPNLADAWMTLREVLEFNGVSGWLYDHASQLTLAVGLGVGAFALRFRATPIAACVLLWLSFYAFSPSFFMQYLVWGFPFFLLAGHLRAAIWLQVCLLPAIVIVYLIPWPTAAVAKIYVPIMLTIWLFWLAATVLATRGVIVGSYRPLLTPRIGLDEPDTNRDDRL